MAGQRKYTDAQIETGLATLALMGSQTLASRELGIPKETLHHWARVQYPERFVALRKQKVGEIRERAAQRSEDIARAAAEKELEFIEGLHVEELEPRDRSNALRNLSTTRGISVDVARKLRDEPDSIVEHRHSGTELIDQIERRFPHLVAEGTAEEVEDAEVVEPKQLKAA